MESVHYAFVPGFFVQDDPNANGASVGALPPRFGLLDSSGERWAKFKQAIDELNNKAEDGTSYKAIFFGRHGEGFHNVAEAKYGTSVSVPNRYIDLAVGNNINSYWSKLDGDGELTWGPDPYLTKIGEGQAVLVNTTWRTELKCNIPVPRRLYCSPMTRAMQTNLITFGDLPHEEKCETIVLENCREEYGQHTCDKRRSLSYIRTAFPKFKIEPGFTEEDEQWTPDERETPAHIELRARAVLDQIFNDDKDDFLISVTAHGGVINAFLRVLGRQNYALPTGGVIPVVVERKTG